VSLSRRALLFGQWADPDVQPAPEPVPVPVREPAPHLVNWLEADRSVAPLAEGKRVAKVQTFSCLNAMGSFCSTCIERCPEPGAIVAEGRRVVVVPDRCTGCGLCADVCPAPGNAILLVPFRSPS
jgi:Pyruvate/2-oxoacid:ferredoxin oxidoreductase delta subunit